MHAFIARHAAKITGVLKGLDRVLFRGHLSRLDFADGVAGFFQRQRVLLKDFGEFAEALTTMIRDEAVAITERVGRPVRYLESSTIRKENVARQILAEHPIKAGLICLLTCVEPCTTWQVFRRKAQSQELRRRRGKCLHHYFYFRDPTFGLMHVRVQSWMPFTVQVCLNGREWLGNQLDAAGIGYRRAANCFLAIDDLPRAQQIMDELLTLPWRQVLDRFVTTVNPVLDLIAAHALGSYRWSLHQCEFATDVMFRRAADLAALYPSLARYAIADLSSRDTMRFLGKHLVETFRGEVVTTYKHRPEGICVRHACAGNSIKMYDKQGSILRIETTTNNPAEFKRRRHAEGDPDSEVKLRPLRKGIADMKVRAKASADANARYLDALATVESSRKLHDILARTRQRVDLGTRKGRALRPWANPDLDLLRAIASGQFITNGFRNRDILPLVQAGGLDDPETRRKAAAKLSRHLRLLCAHKIIRRIEGTHRYVVTTGGRTFLTAIVAALDASISKLKQCA